MDEKEQVFDDIFDADLEAIMEIAEEESKEIPLDKEQPEEDFQEDEEVQQDEQSEQEATEEEIKSEESEDNVTDEETGGDLGNVEYLANKLGIKEVIGEDIKEAESPEDLIELYVNKRLESALSKLPPEVRAINREVLSGKPLSKVLEEFKEVVSDDTIDLSTEDGQIAAIKKYYELKGEDPDIVQANIEAFKKAGNLKDVATKFNEKLEQVKQELVKRKEKEALERQKREEEAIVQAKKKLREDLLKNKEVDGIKFSEDDIKNLPNYLYDKTVKTEDGRILTPFQADLQRIVSDKNKLVVLAKLLKNNLNLEKLIGDTKAKTTKKKIRKSDEDFLI